MQDGFSRVYNGLEPIKPEPKLTLIQQIANSTMEGYKVSFSYHTEYSHLEIKTEKSLGKSKSIGSTSIISDEAIRYGAKVDLEDIIIDILKLQVENTKKLESGKNEETIPSNDITG